MSSAATITFDRGTKGVPLKEWQSFCEEQNIEHSPNTVGGNVYYHGGLGGVEASHDVHTLRFSTFYGGQAMAAVARLTMVAWTRWGGTLEADPEIRRLIFLTRSSDQGDL